MLAYLLVLAAAVSSIPPIPRIAFQPEQMRWVDAPPSLPAGSKMVVLEGNPREAGMFTMRVRVPAGSLLAPHWHPRDERVTVLAGTAEVGFGVIADRRNVTRYGAGSFYVNPPREMHYVFFAEETELQMTGVGPWEIHMTDIQPQPGDFTTSRVIVRGITPHAGAELDADTELVAKVDYDIPNFRPSTFYFTMQFETEVEGRTFTRSGPQLAKPGEIPAPPPRAYLESARGMATVRQAMEPILGEPRLKRPIRVRVYLHEELSDATSNVAGMSDWIEYR